jgi:hypothetical protein
MELFARGFQGHIVLNEGNNYGESIVIGERDGNPIARRWVNEYEVEIWDIGLTTIVTKEFPYVVMHSDLKVASELCRGEVGV